MSKPIKMCPAPFLSQAMWADGRASMCCNDTSTHQLTIDEEWSSESRKQVQREWLEGKVPERCLRCIERDSHGESGLYSHYLHLYKDWSRFNLIKASRARPRYLHLSPTNKCNVGCRICAPFISSTYGKLFGHETVTDHPILNWIKSCEVDHYYAHGGESLMSEEHREAVRYFSTLPHPPSVTILTNGTIYDQDWIDILSKIPNVLWQISLDGYESLNDKVRIGTKTKRVKENWDKVRQALPHAKFSIHSTFSIYNSHDLQQSYEYIAQYNPDFHSFCVGHNPGRISVSNLPKREKEKLLEELATQTPQGTGPVWDNFVANQENIRYELELEPRDPIGYRDETRNQNARLNEKLQIPVLVLK